MHAYACTGQVGSSAQRVPDRLPTVLITEPACSSRWAIQAPKAEHRSSPGCNSTTFPSPELATSNSIQITGQSVGS
jgi:hypothetical protein